MPERTGLKTAEVLNGPIGSKPFSKLIIFFCCVFARSGVEPWIQVDMEPDATVLVRGIHDQQQDTVTQDIGRDVRAIHRIPQKTFPDQLTIGKVFQELLSEPGALLQHLTQLGIIPDPGRTVGAIRLGGHDVDIAVIHEGELDVLGISVDVIVELGCRKSAIAAHTPVFLHQIMMVGTQFLVM